MGGYQGRRVQPPRRRRTMPYQGRWVQEAPGPRPSQRQGRRVLPSSRWRRPALLLLTAVLLVSCGLLARDLVRAHREQAAYRTLAQRVHEARRPAPAGERREQTTETNTPQAADLSQAETSQEETPAPYEALARENPDLAGWLSIADTAVDYPVMWTPEEPEYYLRRAFDRSRAVSGSLFIGAGCAPDGAHVIIYGHNMNDGSMFGSLSGYAQEDYAAAHPVIRFDTLDRTGEYRVLAAFYSHAYTPGEEGFRYYRCTDLSRPEDFERYVRQAREAALYDTGTPAEYGDRLLTLSTCSYHRENGTFVVVAAAPAALSSGQAGDENPA